jgi:hypothetical protein
VAYQLVVVSLKRAPQSITAHEAQKIGSVRWKYLANQQITYSHIQQPYHSKFDVGLYKRLGVSNRLHLETYLGGA